MSTNWLSNPSSHEVLEVGPVEALPLLLGAAGRVERYDCRTGGSYRFVHVRGDDEFWFHGSFHEVREGELIVQTFTFEGEPDSVALEKTVFEDLGDGRCRLVATSLVDSFEGRDAFVSGGMESGVVEGYERLDDLLA